MKRYLGLASVAVTAPVVALLVATGSAAATGGPTLTISSDAPDHGFIRGSAIGTVVTASGLQPGTSYTFRSDHLIFNGSGTHTETLRTASTGTTLLPNAWLPAADPVTEVTATMTAANDSTVLATLDAPVAHPFLELNGFPYHCPGHPTTLYGRSFAAGSYLLQSDTATTSSSPMQAGNGNFSFYTTITLGNAIDFSVSATATGDNTPTVVQPLRASAAQLSIDQISDPWHAELGGTCFIPGEQVSLSAAEGLSVPATATVNQFGGFAVNVLNQPDPQIDPPVAVTVTGQTSHQQAVLGVELARATLLPGQVLQGSGYDHDLASSGTPGYYFEPSNCAAPIWHLQSDGGTVAWSALLITSANVSSSDCSLLMQTDGNAVLRSAAGTPIWSTGTHVAGSHLLLTNSGSLQVISPGGAVLWNSSIAPSRVSIASSRYRSAVYINGLVQQRAPTSQLVRGAGRTVYLQRYLNGHWQNMLARTADSQGQLAVGFIQTQVFQYRLVLLPTASAAGATSSSTFR